MSDIQSPDATSLSEHTDEELLAAFVRGRSEKAFAELVHRHAGWVQGVAQRSLADRELAQEVTQNVLVLLAQKAARVKPEALGPWLHRVTVLECGNARRRERTRQRTLIALTREPDFMDTNQSTPDRDWQAVLPVLDDAVNTLPERERTVVVQRFLQQRSWREIGASTGRSEDSVRMALGPALEHLERLLRRRGVTAPATVLAAALTFAGKFTGTASAALLSKNVLAASVVRPAVTPWRSGHVVWLSSFSCLVLGTVISYHFTAPDAGRAPAVAAVTREAGPPGGATGGGSSAGDGFDLMAVMESLRLLKPSGNDIESIVRLRAALMKMPASAVSQVLPAMRKGRWGRDSAQVAEAFFYRWAVLDAEAAWNAFREPDFLGAADKTTRAVLLGMGRDDPARFVRLLNTLPDTGTYQTEARSAIIRNLGSLPAAEVLPHLQTLQSASRRRELIGLLLNRSPAAPNIGLVAPVAATLPPAEAGELIPLISKQWYRADPGGFHQWQETLLPRSPQHWATMIGEATALSAGDPAGAGKLLAGIPWNRSWQTDLKEIVTRWMEADRPGAEQWLTTDAMVPASLRKELLGAVDKTKEGGP